ncbi:serine/threonine-protein kinase 17B isoform X2 [Hyla sarda]|uniref:serine/threonine-protein kinase 17B isoform X2 n=1 Tax=Hyla sarda TaxID=327740 RepID=UPI0024C29FF4|nr:serine/threonine-protein kinase 17B isoform X2 [Hyla sarda]
MLHFSNYNCRARGRISCGGSDRSACRKKYQTEEKNRLYAIIMLRSTLEDKIPLDCLYSSIHTSIKVENFHDVYSMDTNLLGRGKFAVVRRCTERTTGREFAAKFLKKRRRGKDCRAEIIHEIAVLEIAKINPHIVDLHEVYETSHEIILILEYAAGGEIFNLCAPDRNDNISERQIITLLRQIIEGVKFLHENNIVHLDLKLQNILLSRLEPPGNIKIVDFGMSRKIGNSEIREIMGTTEYLAPEVLNYEPITTATDIWSIGVICYMLLTGVSPFAGVDNQETYLNISQIKVDYSEETFTSGSREAVHFIKSILVKKPENRASAADCLAHPWLQLTETNLYGHQRLSISHPEEHVNRSNDFNLKSRCNRMNKDRGEDKENIQEDNVSTIKRFRLDSTHHKHYCI